MPQRMDLLRLISQMPPERLGHMVNRLAMESKNQGVYDRPAPGLIPKGPIVSLGPGRAAIR